MIHVSVDSNEAMRPRAVAIRKAVEKDDRFVMAYDMVETPFDLRFDLEDVCEKYYEDVCCEPCSKGPCTKFDTLHMELKDFSEAGNSDYLASILSGHLYEQVLAAREIGEPLVIAVLGDDNDVGAAIRKAASRNHRMDPKKLMQYYEMVEGFEANCLGCGVRVWRLKTDPWKRLLLRVRKILEGGDLSGFAPKPADGERQAVGLSILAGRGVGPKMARNILDRFNVCLAPKDGFCGGLEDCGGIGPKRAEMIRKNLEVVE
jgi:hypothetical protein